MDIIKKSVLQSALDNITNDEIDALFEENLKLPPIPAIASELLRILSNPFSDARELSQLVEKDPSLTAQILKFCSSSFSGFRGEVESIQDAINRVLGYEVTCNLVLGLVLAKQVKMQNTGALGAAIFWKNALACAATARQVAVFSKTKAEVKPGTAYLSGMLHHIGLAVLNVQFPELFSALNTVKEANPNLSLSELEKATYGNYYEKLNHGALGGLLLKQWQLPLHLIEVCRNHQNIDYAGEFQELVWSVQLSEAIIAKLKYSDEASTDANHIASKLGIDEETLQKLTDQFDNSADSIDATSKLML